MTINSKGDESRPKWRIKLHEEEAWNALLSVTGNLKGKKTERVSGWRKVDAGTSITDNRQKWGLKRF